MEYLAFFGIALSLYLLFECVYLVKLVRMHKKRAEATLEICDRLDNLLTEFVNATGVLLSCSSEEEFDERFEELNKILERDNK